MDHRSSVRPPVPMPDGIVMTIRLLTPEYYAYKNEVMCSQSSPSTPCHDCRSISARVWRVYYYDDTGLFPYTIDIISCSHYNDVIMSAMASQITSLTIVFSTVYSDADQRNYQSSASLAFVRAIHRWPVKSPHKCPVPRKMFSFDDVIMFYMSLSAIWDRNSVIPLPAEILLPDGSKPSTVTILI